MLFIAVPENLPQAPIGSPVNPVTPGVHACFGFNLINRLLSYQAPDYTRIPTQVVTSIPALQAAINSKVDHEGAVIQLAGGDYTSSSTGIVVGSNRRNLTIYSDPSDRAVIDFNLSTNYGVTLRQQDGGVIENISIIGFHIKNMNGHGMFFGGDTVGHSPGSNIAVLGNIVENSSNSFGAGIVIRGSGVEDDSGYLIEGNEIFNIGLSNPNTGTNNRGEGIYIGAGSIQNRWVNTVTIRSNHIHGLRAEAIDIKRNSRNINIEYNHIHDVEVSSQGAVVLGMDNRIAHPDFDANVDVYRNRIYRVTKRAYNGNGIVCAYGHSRIRENLIYDTAADAVTVYNDNNRGFGNVILTNNLIWNYNGLAIRENTETANNGPNNPFTITRTGNIVESNPGGTDCQHDASIFEGPLTTVLGFAPKQ